MTPAEDKRALRRAAEARRAEVCAALGAGAPAARLVPLLAPHAGRRLSAYVAMRGEADPMPALLAHRGPVCLPVVAGRGLPLGFREWAPGAPLVEGAYRALIPAEGAEVTPEVLIVPMLAFDRRGFRLGYGGGFYDRTLAALRAANPATLAIGLAFAAQEVPALPVEPTDAALDLIVTEAGVIRPGGAR